MHVGGSGSQWAQGWWCRQDSAQPVQKSVRKAEEMCQLIERKVFIFQMSVCSVKNKLRCSEQGIRRDEGMF